MRVLVLTTVHTPADARIARRQIETMLSAGWEVQFAAPWTAFELEPPAGMSAIDVPRASGRRRWRAFLAARRVLRTSAAHVDLVLLHDPELLLAAWASRVRTPVVWDVHEDASTALIDRSWVPGPLRRIVAGLTRFVERRAEDRCLLILAEDAYAGRFRGTHPVIRNVPPVPDVMPEASFTDRVVQVGRLSRLRGVYELIELGRLLTPEGIRVELVGPVDADVRDALDAAVFDGVIVWHGFVPNQAALELVDGALVGMSLLHDVPNYRVSLPTKVVEYLSRGVPVITTPLPVARDVVERHDVGVVVPFGDVAAAAEAVRRLRGDVKDRCALRKRAYLVAQEHFAWQNEAERFLDVLRGAAKAQR